MPPSNVHGSDRQRERDRGAPMSVSATFGFGASSPAAPSASTPRPLIALLSLTCRSFHLNPPLPTHRYHKSVRRGLKPWDVGVVKTENRLPIRAIDLPRRHSIREDVTRDDDTTNHLRRVIRE